MDFSKQNAEYLFDGFDCPQRLDSLEQARVDDSWFLHKSAPSGKNVSPMSEPINKAFSDRHSAISEKENLHGISTDNVVKFSSSNASESPASPIHFAALNLAAALAPVESAAEHHLATENRCQQRTKWETLRLQRERRHEELRQKRKESLCRHEQERVQHMRTVAVPKAQPIRHYKPLRIHRSEKPLTVAKSPDFAHSRKERRQHQNQLPE